MAKSVDVDQLNIVLEADDKASAKIDHLIEQLKVLNKQVGRGFDVKGLKAVTKTLKQTDKDAQKTSKATKEFADSTRKADGKSMERTAKAMEKTGKSATTAKDKIKSITNELGSVNERASKLDQSGTLGFVKSQKALDLLKMKYEGVIKKISELRKTEGYDKSKMAGLVGQAQNLQGEIVSQGGRFEGMSGLQKVASVLNGIGAKSQQIGGKIGSIATSFASAIHPALAVLNVLRKIVGVVVTIARTAIKIATTIYKIAKTVAVTLGKAIVNIGKGVATVGKGIAKIGSIPLKPIIGGFQLLGNKIQGVLGKIVKMVKMRIYRLVAKYIVSGFYEGFNNAYYWAAQFGNRFATSMDRVSTSALYLKNSLGAMAMPIMNVVAPALDYLIDKAVAALNVINQLIARLTGQSTWTKAVKVPKAYADNMADAASSAQKLNKELITILGIDEINPMEGMDDSPSGGGGGGAGGADYGSMFEEAEFTDYANDLADKIKKAWAEADFTEIGEMVGAKINEALNRINWDAIKKTSEKIGSSLATFINGALLVTDEFDHTPLDNIAITVAEGLNTAFVGVGAFADKIKAEEIGKAVSTAIGTGLNRIDWATIESATGQVATKLAQFINGAFTVKDANKLTVFDNIGIAVANGVNTVFGATGKFLKELKAQEIGTNIGNGIVNALGKINWTTIENTLETLGKKIADFINGFFKADGNGQTPFSAMTTTIGKALKSALSGVSTLLTNTEFTKIGANIGKSISNLFSDTELMTKVGNTLNEAIQGAFDFLAGLLGDDGLDLNEVVSGLKTALGQIPWKEHVKTALGLTESFIKELIDAIIFGSKEHKQEYLTGITNTFGVEVNQEGSYDEFGNYTPAPTRPTITPNIPSVEIEGTINFNKSKNSLTEGQSTLPGKANFLSSQNGLTGSNLPLIGSKANLTSSQNGLTGKKTPSLSSKANFTSWQRDSALKGGGKKFPTLASKANFTSWQRDSALKGGGKKFPTLASKANFTSWLDNIDPKIKSDANFTRYYNSLVGSSTPKIPSIADFDRYYATYSNRAEGGSFYGGKWHSIPQYATGGAPAHGGLFYAGEHGAELVGHVGGRTEVLNQSQLASTMYSSVVSANASQNRLLQEQNNLLAQLLQKTGDSRAYITSGDIVDALSQKNRRDGRTVVPVGA